jgi:hypothetical protein
MTPHVRVRVDANGIGRNAVVVVVEVEVVARDRTGVAAITVALEDEETVIGVTVQAIARMMTTRIAEVVVDTTTVLLVEGDIAVRPQA